MDFAFEWDATKKLDDVILSNEGKTLKHTQSGQDRTIVSKQPLSTAAMKAISIEFTLSDLDGAPIDMMIGMKL